MIKDMRKRGVALITAMLITALTGSLAGSYGEPAIGMILGLQED